jgi:hypothetical protein
MKCLAVPDVDADVRGRWDWIGVRLSGDVGERLMIVEQRFHKARPIMQHDNGIIP